MALSSASASAGAGGAAPTGCYKCGRPGHWSRDCPSSAPTISKNSTSVTNPNPNSNPASSSFHFSKPSFSSAVPSKEIDGNSSEKPKKVRRTRPKLTPELLLSDDGLGYVLRHFPRHFKYRGRGHEVADLGNLISLYSEWHSHLIPKFSFDQFVQKVEQVGTTRHVKMCLRELKERVANGGDPTKLHESPVEVSDPNHEQAKADASVHEECSHLAGDSSLDGPDTVDAPEDMLQGIYEEVTQEAPRDLDSSSAAAGRVSSDNSVKELQCQGAEDRVMQITEDQRGRMEANRLKALQRAAARAL